MYCNCGDCQAPAVEVAEVSGAPQEVPSLIWGCSIFCGWDYFVDCLYCSHFLFEMESKLGAPAKASITYCMYCNCGDCQAPAVEVAEIFWHGARGPITDLGLLHLVCMILHCFSFIKLQLGSEYNSIRWWYSILRLLQVRTVLYPHVI